jgi:hypothetical protein
MKNFTRTAAVTPAFISFPRTCICSHLAATTFLLLFALGCGGENSNLAPVTGIVRVNGQPLSSGRVVFQPTTAGINALAQIGADGTFTLATKDEPGALIGEHKVAIIATEKGAGGRPDPTAGRQPLKWLVAEKYQAAGTSGLVREVKAGENHFEFDLEGP